MEMLYNINNIDIIDKFNNIIKTKFKYKILLDKHNKLNNDYVIYIYIYNIYIKIFTDFNKFCIAEKLNDERYNIDKFNINIISLEKSPIQILQELMDLQNTKNDNIVVFNDDYNIFRKSKEFNKYKIIFDEYNSLLIKYNELNILAQLNIKIPKELLLSNFQINKIIINEIKKINSNYNYEHYILYDDINPYLLILRLKYNKNSKVYDLFQKLNKLYNFDYIELKILLDHKLHPYVPPIIDYIKPNIKIPLLLSILNLDILKLKNWSTSISLEYLITSLGDQLEKKISEYIIFDDNINKLEYEIIKLNNFNNKLNYENLIDIKYNKSEIDISTKNKNINYFASGTGYGSNTSSNWDINIYIKDQEKLQIKVTKCLNNIYNILITSNIEYTNNSILLEYLNIETKGLNVFELDINILYYNEIFNILKFLISNKLDEIFINNICNNVRLLSEELNILFSSSSSENINKHIIYINNIINIYFSKEIKFEQIKNNNGIEEYCNTMKKLQFDNYEIPSNHRFIKKINIKSSPKTIMRILSEISSLKSGLPVNWESTIWVKYSKDNYNLISFLISGPKNTPYENGLFEFHAYFPQNYPEGVPEVLLHTTGNNNIRFNPNLYKDGKVCLSLLGTWSGSAGESWNPKTSTFLQVLISIQSLILVDDPYFNEPGYETTINTTLGNKLSKEYNENLYPHTIQLAMIDMITNPPIGFEEIVKNHFKLKKEEIINTVNKWNTKNNLNLIIEKVKNVLDTL
jgi:ubiquitin-protein ligase